MNQIQILPSGGLKARMTEREFNRTKTVWHERKQYRINAAKNAHGGNGVIIFAYPTGAVF